MMDTRVSMECAICFEVYQNPHILGCNHTFCKQCIDDLTLERNIKCPLCNFKSNADFVKPNYALIEAVQVMERMEHCLKIQSKNIKDLSQCNVCSNNIDCGLCESGKIVCHCVDCKEWMCESCTRAHMKIQVTKGHTIETLPDCNKKVKDDMTTHLEIFEVLIEQHPHKSSQLKKEISTALEIQKNTLERSAWIQENYITDIKHRFNQINAEINNICEERIRNLERYFYNQRQEIQAMKIKHAELKNVIEESKNDLAIAGKKILVEAKHLSESRLPELVITEPFSVQVVHWPILKSEGDFVIKSRSDLVMQKNPGAALMVLSRMLGRQLKLQKSAQIHTMPSLVRLIDGQLWQCHWNGISVFTLDLEPVKQIPSGDMGRIKDVASAGRDEVVVASEKGLYSLQNDGVKRISISNEGVFSVCIYEKQLFAATRGSNIRVYRRRDSTWWRRDKTWEQHRSFSVEMAFRTLDVNNAGIFMCSITENKFYHYSHSGVMLSNFGSMGNGIGQMYQPRLCSVDSSGSALIADRGNNRLKLLSSSGTWNVIDLLPRVKRPQCGLFYIGKLYVSSQDKILYMFSVL